MSAKKALDTAIKATPADRADVFSDGQPASSPGAAIGTFTAAGSHGPAVGTDYGVACSTAKRPDVFSGYSGGVGRFVPTAESTTGDQ